MQAQMHGSGQEALSCKRQPPSNIATILTAVGREPRHMELQGIQRAKGLLS
eukprot:CAMPEP_0115235624 /NCGR_PEP_ID=MMETSP0270-20121206/35416_1 /TAXON_ID=71861 /ORGANISM="Scrippsiella trochoidea, Strain CCMP3099" /LENGTH=50 /DNA_ID=CAMNT_0002650431 /DNA_START=32 /DNA_END=182 /DNA_ORIENTATION=+